MKKDFIRQAVIQENLIQTINALIVRGFFNPQKTGEEIMESLKEVTKYYKHQIKVGSGKNK